jgi:dolichol-phosphate mannosyltransferase
MIVAVVTPTYNEQDNVAEITNAILKEQVNVNPKYELHVVISDSHSPDNTGKIATELASKNNRVHFLDVVERGIGYGIIKGFEYAIDKLNADILIQIDADLSHPASAIPEMLRKIDEGYDLVIGSRFTKGGSNNDGPYRKFQSYMGNQLLRFLVGLYNLQEFLTSYRAMTRTLYQKANLDNVQWRAKTFVFQPTFVYELMTHNPKYVEIPIVFTNRRLGRSKMNTLRYIRDVLTFGVKIRIKNSKQFIKFLIVGGTGFLINTIGLVVFHQLFNIPSPTAASLGAEIAIISNFFLNNFWTFRHSKADSVKAIALKLLQFNLSSLGAIVIQYVVLYLGERFITPPILQSVDIDRIYLTYLYYVFAVGLGLIYNYIMYSRVIWKKQQISSPAVRKT